MLYPRKAHSPAPTLIFVVFQTGARSNGGVESITQVIKQHRGVAPLVITQLATPMTRQWHQLGAAVQVWSLPYAINSSFYRSPILAQWRRLWTMVHTNWRMVQLVRATAPAIVHCNDPSAMLHTALGAKWAGAWLIFHIRDIHADPAIYAGWRWWVFRGLSDRLLVLSQEMKSALSQRLGLSQRQQASVEPIYSIVDQDRFYPVGEAERQQIRDRLHIAPHTVALGYIATFNPKKAQLDFIQQGIPRLKQALPNLRVYFIGDFEPTCNGYAQQCLQAVEELQLTDIVCFINYTPDIDLWYRALDLVVLASRHEGLARCMIESLACGTPVVSFDVCSAQEILEHYQCGQVAPQGNYDALTAKIVATVQDGSLRQFFRQNGIRMAKTAFTAERALEQYETLYLSLTGIPDILNPHPDRPLCRDKQPH